MSEDLCDSQTSCANQVGGKFKHVYVVIAIVLIFFSLFYFCFTGYVKDILFGPEQQIAVLTEESVKVKPEPAPLARDRFFPNNNPRVDWFDVGSSDELIGWLKEFNLWDIPVGTEIPAMIVNDFPAFGQVDVATKKKMFINTLLPVALTANNLFGMRTWGEEGIVPTKRDAGKNHRIVIYESILDSVQAYILNLNRLPAYDEFRRMRQATMDSVFLANGLSKYSIQGEEYIWNVQAVIHHNHLRDYDKVTFQKGYTI